MDSDSEANKSDPESEDISLKIYSITQTQNIFENELLLGKRFLKMFCVMNDYHHPNWTQSLGFFSFTCSENYYLIDLSTFLITQTIFLKIMDGSFHVLINPLAAV